MEHVSYFELDRVKFFRTYPSLKPHILYHSNGLAIWHGFPDNKHIINIKDNNANGHKALPGTVYQIWGILNLIMADSQPF